MRKIGKVLLALGFVALLFGCDKKNKENTKSKTSVITTKSKINTTTSRNITSNNTPIADTYYTIKFVNYDDTVLSTQSVKKGDMPSYIGDTPRKESDNLYDYVFSGWDKNIQSAYEDRIYKAQYNSSGKKYTITYELGGGTNSYDNPSYYYTTWDTFSLKAPERNYYYFDGWYYNNEKVSEIDPSIASNITLIAKWSGMKYFLETRCNITIDGATRKAGEIYHFEEQKASNEYEYGSVVTLRVEPYAGCVLDGWYDENDNLLSKNLSFDYTISSSYGLDVVAKMKPAEEMRDFYYTPSKTGCYVYEVIDKTISEVILPNYVNELSTSTFSGCSGITKITLPKLELLGSLLGFSTVTDVIITDEVELTAKLNLYGDRFKNAKNLFLPNCLEKISSDVFNDCNNLESVYYDGTIEDWCKISFGNSKSNPMYYGYADYFYYRDENGTTIYNSKNFTKLTELIIPSSIEDLSEISIVSLYKCAKSIVLPNGLTEIGGQFSNKDNLESIIIPSSVTSISSSAFSSCANLKSICIPNLVTRIEERTFYECSSLENIIIKGDIAYIGADAFKNCTNLKGVYLNENAINWWCNLSFDLEGEYDCTNYYNEDLRHNYNNPMIYAENIYVKDNTGNIEFVGERYNYITKITLPSNLTKIGYIQFKGFNKLEEVIFNDVIEEIGKYAFDSCTSLKSIEIPNTVARIGEFAFKSCSSLEKLSVPFVGCSESVDSYENYFFVAIFGNEEFEGSICVSAYDAKINNKSNGYFNYNRYIPQSLKEVIITNASFIAAFAFKSVSTIETICFSNTIKNIYFDAFYECNNLKDIYYNGSIEDWCGILFDEGSDYNCGHAMYYADNIYFKDELGEILYNNVKYTIPTEIIIPNTITSIGYHQFYGFKQITNIIIPNSVTSIGVGAFARINSLEFNEYDNGFYLGNSDNPYLLLFKAKSTDITSISIHSDCKFIYDNALNGCSEITDLTIPNGALNVGRNALYDCANLVNINIPSTITRFENDAFCNCDNLVNVFYDGTINDWIDIAFINTSGDPFYPFSNPMYSAAYRGKNPNFYIADNLGDVEHNGKNYSIVKTVILPANITILTNTFSGFKCLTNVRLNDSLETIGVQALAYCRNINSIVIPVSLKTIEKKAFYNCIGLSKVYYKGVEAQWNDIEIGNDNTRLTDATLYFYSDEEPSISGNYWHYVNGEIVEW